MSIINENGVTSRKNGAIVNGNNCSVYGQGSIVNGNRCKIYGEGCIINGDYCDLYAKPSVVNGEKCKIFYQKRDRVESVIDELFAPMIREQERMRREDELRTQKVMDEIFGRSEYSFYSRPSAPPRSPPKPSPKPPRVPNPPAVDILTELSKIKDVETEDESKACTICITNEKIIALPCGHRKTCASCTAGLVRSKAPCPVCRKEFGTFLRTFD